MPIGAGTVDVAVALPQSARATAVCVWECGLVDTGSAAAATAAATGGAFDAQWVSFDGGDGGYNKLRAVAPPAAAAAAPRDVAACTAVWQAGTAAAGVAAIGIESATWAPIAPGRTMLPALALRATSGSYAFFARPCS